TSLFPGNGGADPSLSVDTEYFVGNDGFSRGMVDTSGDPKLSGTSNAPVWLGQIVSVTDAQSQAHVFGQYYVAASSNPWTALAELDPAAAKFKYVSDFAAGQTLPS